MTRTHALCENCDQPVHTDGDYKRGWIHTVSGNYSCEGGGGFAAPAEPVGSEGEELLLRGHRRTPSGSRRSDLPGSRHDV